MIWLSQKRNQTGMHLKEYLFKAGINQSEFARKLGVSRTHLTMIALGKSRPSPELAKKIMDETEGRVTVMELLFPKDHPKPSLRDESN